MSVRIWQLLEPLWHQLETQVHHPGRAVLLRRVAHEGVGEVPETGEQRVEERVAEFEKLWSPVTAEAKPVSVQG